MPQHDAIFAYFVTVNRFDRLEKSLVGQIKIGIGLSHQSYLIVDHLPASIPDVIASYFGDRIVAEDPFVLDEHGDRSLSFSKLRNSAIRVARQSKASWMFFCDADTVFIKLDFPKIPNYYALPYVYWQKSEEETLSESIREIENGGVSVFSEGNSWFVLHRNVFESLDFNESLHGYGWEDLEFSDRVQAGGFAPGRCGTHIVHMFHTQEDRQVNWQQFNRNRAIFEAVQIEIKNGHSPDWRNSETLQTFHPAWVTDLYFNYTTKIVINPLSKTANRFEILEGNYVISWNDWPAEVFERVSTRLKYIAPLSDA